MTDDYSRDDESRAERLDRNYGELLQELRVAQTGVQILFAFLLTIAFQERFTRLTHYEHVLYAVTLLLAALAAILLIAPAAGHRVLFRRHRKDDIVDYGAKLASLGLCALALAMVSAVLFTLTVAVDVAFGAVISGVMTVAIVLAWLVLPLRHDVGENGRTDA